MILPVLRAGSWPAVAGISGVAVVVGGCGMASPAIAPVLLTIAFTLLATAAAFALDEPASQVVDVTPTGPVRRTGIRALALLAPVTAGAVLMLAGAQRGLALPWAATGLALAGNVVLGFAVACVARTRTGEPGAPVSGAVALVLMAPTILPFVARRVSTFPASDGDGLSSSTVWSTVLAVCMAAVALSIDGRLLAGRRPVRGDPVTTQRTSSSSRGDTMSAAPRQPSEVGRFVAIGGLCGLTWAASLRGWMVELAAGESTSSVTWLTFALLLLPGLAIGVLFGWSAYLRSTGIDGSRWLIFAPVLFASALLDPEIFSAFIHTGEGGGSLMVVATALCSGFVLSRRRWSIAGAACALVALLGLLLLGSIGTMAAPLSSARGAWVCLFGLTLVLLLCLASVLPYPPVRPPRGATSWVALGVLGGLAWACALRSFMAAVAGVESGVDWGLTFGYILLPGAVIGGLLGWAEFLRRHRDGPGRRRLAYAPLLFAAVLVPGLLHPDSFLDGGIGGGAIGVPVIAMLGGFAISGRGPAWGRALAGLGFTAGFVVWLLVAVQVGGESFALDTPHGLWVSVLYESLLVTFALAASVPHRPGGRRGSPVPTPPRARLTEAR